MGDGLHLRLLGELAVEWDNTPMALPPSKKARALLAYLALSDRVERRERLCEIFWEIPDDPRSSLRWALSKIRTLVDRDGTARLIADQETVRFDKQDVVIDFDELKRLATDAENADLDALATAIDNAGEFLAGLDLPRCDIFQAWLVAFREDVRQLRLRGLAALVARLTDPDRILVYARQRVELDPMSGDFRVSLIEALVAARRLVEADQQRLLSIEALTRADIPVPHALRRPPARPAASPVAEPAAPGPHPEPSPMNQQVRFCRAEDGTGLAYAVTGDGPPIVKTANWLNHLEYDFEGPYWKHWISEFSSHNSFIRYDARGNGLSDWDPPELSFEAFVADLEAVVDALGLETFDLLAVSQGCAVATAFAARHPHRVKRMIFYGGYVRGWAARNMSEGDLARRVAMVTLTREGWGQNNPAFRQLFSSLYFPEATPTEMEWFNELQRLSTSPANAVHLQEVLSRVNVTEYLPQVKAPTLVLHARDDAVIPFANGRELALGLPNARFVPLEGKNHLLLEREPAWTSFTRAVSNFLKETAV